VTVPIGDRAVEGALLEGRLGERVPIYFVAQDGYYDRPGLYGASDDCERFVFFCRSVLAALPSLGWTPQVVHANDWQAGLIPVYLETLARDLPAYADMATVFTVHNLAYQGVFWHYDLPMTGLGWDLFTPAGIEFYGHLSLLKGGLVFADLLTTVSPTYAREIQTPEFGERMDGILRERSADLVGIVNGLDVLAWNPATDPDIPKRFDRDDPSGKAACAAALRDEVGLPDSGRRTPLVGVVSRLAAQKGIDLVAESVPAIQAAGGQLVVLGSGEEPLERLLGGSASTTALPGASTPAPTCSSCPRATSPAGWGSSSPSATGPCPSSGGPAASRTRCGRGTARPVRAPGSCSTSCRPTPAARSSRAPLPRTRTPRPGAASSPTPWRPTSRGTPRPSRTSPATGGPSRRPGGTHEEDRSHHQAVQAR
jgi:hypothetical protein